MTQVTEFNSKVLEGRWRLQLRINKDGGEWKRDSIISGVSGFSTGIHIAKSVSSLGLAFGLG